MLGKPLPGKKTSSAAAGTAAGDARFLHEIEALSKALSLDPKPHRRSLPSSSSSSRSVSAGRSHPSKPSKKPSSSSSSIWNWKPFRALSHIGRHRFDCLFTLHVHSIDAIPQSLASAGLAVNWRRTTDPSASAACTRTARAFHSVAEFDETLTHICSVYASRGSGGSAKYEARHVLIYVAVNDAPGLDLGRHLVDLTRILPLSLEELAEEKASGRWSTSFKLSGKAKGAVLNVSLGYSLVRNQSKSEPEKKVPEILNARVNQQNSIDAVRDDDGHDPSSMEDVKVLHAVLPSSHSDVSGHADVHKELVAKLESLEVDFIVDQEKDSPELKVCTLPAFEKEIEKEEVDEPPEFMVVEQGVELAERELECHEVDIAQVAVKPEKEVDGALSGEQSTGESKCALLPEGLMIEDLESSVLDNLSALESEDCLVTPSSKELSYNEVKSNYKSGGPRSKSLSLDDSTDSVAAEFLTMLGIEHSPFGLSSDSDPESPRERLWKQFKMESLADGDGIFGLDIGVGKELGFEEYSEDIDLSSIVLEAETELQKATQAMDSKSRAKMMEDAETEALMRQWGLNEMAFQHSPPGSRSGFGSPISLPPEKPIELPPLGEGLGPFLQTKDGGFLRSMSPSLFKNAKNNGGLVMQVSSPLVVPAEMGSGIMDILQNLASVGIEKLSMQASKLMPLEDITGKTMHQVAWEAAPTLEWGERQDLLQCMEPEVSVGNGRARKKGKGLDLASSAMGEVESEYVSLEDLAPLAMDKIEALSIEGLRIQSGMSDEEAPSNIRAQSIGEISALQGKDAKNNLSLGLEGAGGLQLLDVRDNGDEVDGLMGLSITLDEWMKLDSGIVEEDQISDRTSKILAAHHANPMELVTGVSKGERKGAKRSGKRWGLLGNNFTVALMVQLRDPLRNYEPVGTPMLALIQVERIFVPPKPKIYGNVSDKENSEIDDELETKPEAVKEDKKEEEEIVPQFKITEVHVAGLKTEPAKKKVWGTPSQQQSGSRWLLASGMGKSNKHPFMKSKTVTKTSQATTTVQPGESLWSISSRVHGNGAKWKELAALNPHIRNPNVIFPNETIRLR
ncbi:LysM domain-containing protein [Dioscorea alata]|uniref:LysM domain-containing protein n=2 Tax=Dioscorea alata TaxID=55571 RepID=A0ACB7TVJ4_DIOAL|nr:LysM domain-containing protein [Dioscorea alata]KAH7651952.1 LysM domain-containing protein [Dioscorea alata]